MTFGARLLTRPVVPFGLVGALVFSAVLADGTAASALAPPPSPVTLTSDILEATGASGSVLDAAAGGGSVGDVVAGVAAGATIDATGVVVGGLAVGYSIGWSAVEVWNWAWGGSHAKNADVPAVPGADWQPTSVLTGSGVAGSLTLSDPTFGTLAHSGSTYTLPVTFSYSTTGVSSAHPFGFNVGPECQAPGLSAVSETVSVGLQSWDSFGTRTLSGQPLHCFGAEVPVGVWVAPWTGESNSASYVPSTTIVFTGYSPPAPNPTRTVHVTGDCQAADGTVSHVGADSAPFTENDSAYPQVPGVACPDGSQLVGYHVVERAPGLSDVDVLDWEAPPSYSGIAEAYPGCGTGACVLTLFSVDPGTGQQIDCFSEAGLCKGWATDPTRDTDYSCKYGTYAVALDECRIYAPTFDDPAADPTYADPGDPLPSPDPGGGAEDSSCPPPLHFGLSLVTPWWYYKVGQCLMQWAFVPSDTDAWTQLRNSLAVTPPFSLFVGGVGWLVAIVDAITGSLNCAGSSLGCSADFVTPDGGTHVDLLASASTLAGSGVGHIIFEMVELGVWVVGGFAMWRTVAARFGGKE